MTYKFTGYAKKTLEISNDIAIRLRHNYVGTEHLLYGLIKEEKDIASRVLYEEGLTPDLILECIEELIGVGNESNLTTLGFTPRTKKVIENAFKEAKKVGTEYIGTEHLLMGILQEADSIAVRIIMDLKVDSQKLYNEVANIINKTQNKAQETENKWKKQNANSALAQYGIDLTALALARKNRSSNRQR